MAATARFNWWIVITAVLVLVAAGFLALWILKPTGGISAQDAEATAVAYAQANPVVETQIVTQTVKETEVVILVQTATPGATDTPAAAVQTATPIATTALVTATQVPPVSTSAPLATVVFQTVFTPDWTGLDPVCPDRAKFLSAHGLTEAQVIWHPAPSVSWEPCEFVIELKPEYYGQVTISLVNGYAYTLAPVGTDVTNMWGGDPLVTSSTLQWGFTGRWGPTYQGLVYKWLDPQNPCEWLVRDWRFGRYWRLPNLGLTPPEVPYYTRVGPYTTLPGNVQCTGWTPPSVDQTVPRDYLQASAMLGGLSNSAEWTSSPDGLNWHWVYSAKFAGSADYCPSGMPCWQTTYLPPNSRGYIELWYQGGPKKFFAVNLSQLMLGNLAVDEFTYHSDPNR